MDTLKDRLYQIAKDLRSQHTGTSLPGWANLANDPPNTYFQQLLGLTSGRITQLFTPGAGSRLGADSLSRLTMLGYNPRWVLEGGKHPKLLKDVSPKLYPNPATTTVMQAKSGVSPTDYSKKPKTTNEAFDLIAKTLDFLDEENLDADARVELSTLAKRADGIAKKVG